MTVRHDDVVGRLVRADRSMVPGHMGGTVRSASLVRDRGDLAGQAVAVPPPAAGGGGQIPTLLVAASNATQAVKDVADYVCDGIGDDVEINAALAALPAAALGSTDKVGQVVLSEGVFTLATGLTATGVRADLVGMGVDATTVRLRNGHNATVTLIGIGPRLVRAMTVDGNRGNQTAGTVTGIAPGSNVRVLAVRVMECSGGGILVEAENVVAQCRVTGCGGTGIHATGSATSIAENYVGSCGVGISSAGPAATVIANNTIRTTTSGAGISTGSTSNSLVVGNFVETAATYGIYAEGRGAVTGNTIVGAGGIGLTLYGKLTAAGNMIDAAAQHGIWVFGPDAAVTGNVIFDAGQHGILVAGDDALVANNRINGSSRATDLTYDQIHVTASRSNVQGNLVRQGANANRPRYGINVAAGTANFATNNDLLTAAATGPLNDAGTGTVTVAGNRTT